MKTPLEQHHEDMEKIEDMRKEIKRLEEEMWGRLRNAQMDCKHEKWIGGFFCSMCANCGIDDM